MGSKTLLTSTAAAILAATALSAQAVSATDDKTRATVAHNTAISLEKTMKCGNGLVIVVAGQGIFFNPHSSANSEDVQRVTSVLKYKGETSIYYQDNGQTVEKTCNNLETVKEG